MVMFATFASIILLMALVPNLGYLTFIPGISITIIHIPVLIGIMLLSFWYALGLDWYLAYSLIKSLHVCFKSWRYRLSKPISFSYT